MTPTTTLAPNLYGLDRDALAAALQPCGVEPYRARQLFSQLYRRGNLEPAQWSDLPSAVRDEIGARFRIAIPSPSARADASDGTVKLTLALPDGGEVEAVAIPAEDRMTFCISSQVGCAFGCRFCMTARLGFIRQLSAGEIVGQIEALMRATGTQRGAHNVVFMGMGEPLHNADNLLAALALLTDRQAFGLGPRRLTVSTVGLPEGIDRLRAAPVVPRLAVSLVAADQPLRAELMPVARKVSLEQLVEAVRRFGAGKRDLPTYEVVLLDGVNDAPRLAHQLADLAVRSRAKVNLIEFNPTPLLPYRPASEERMNFFLRILTQRGVVGTVRRSRGQDAFAACGQLAFLKQLESGTVSALPLRTLD
jgi:23S rRNA (adenine2503-C2)-methyltransferase